VRAPQTADDTSGPGRVADSARDEEPARMGVARFEQRVGVAVEPAGEDAGRDAELIHERHQPVDVERPLVAAEIARDVSVLGLAEERGRRLRSDQIHPDVDDVPGRSPPGRSDRAEASVPEMRAALLEASDKPLEVVDDVDIEDPRAGEVLVRVSHCGVCHSDLSLANGTFPVTAPTVLGHEAAGVVEAIGADVTELVAGDKVVLCPIAACNACYWCVRGEYGCCVNTASVSTGMLSDGHSPLSRHGSPVLRGVGVAGFAEYVITPVTGAVKVPDDTPLEIVCVIGCAVQTGVGAVLNTARSRRAPPSSLSAGRDRHRNRSGCTHRGRDSYRRVRPGRVETGGRTDVRRNRRHRSDHRACGRTGAGDHQRDRRR